MDFEIYWPLGPALSASEPSASPIHNDGGDLFGRFVDNDVASFKGQRDVENLEPSEAAIFPFLLLDANFAGKVQAAYCRCDLSSFIARDITGFWVRTTIDPVMRWAILYWSDRIERPGGSQRESEHGIGTGKR